MSGPLPFQRPLHLARWRLLLSAAGFGLLMLVPPGHADSKLESLKLADGTVLLNGIGVARQLNEELYVATLYASRPTRSAAELLDARQRRRLQLRILADRLYPSGVARHFRDLVSLNNPRDEIIREAKNLNRFYGLFQHGLMHGDELILDNVTGKGLQVSINGQPLGEFSSPLLFDLLLRCFIGDKPPNLQFRSQLLGDQDSSARSSLLSRFATLQPQEERLLIYAGVKAPVVATAAVSAGQAETVAAPGALANANLKAESAPADKPVAAAKASEKPALPVVVEKSTGAAKTAVAEKAVNLEKKTNVVPTKTPVTGASGLIAGVTPGGTTDAVKTAPTKALSADEISALLQRYEGQLRERLMAALEYPRRDMKRKYGITQMARQKGKVMLRLHLDTGGDINAAWLQERTGEAILDNAALALVDKLAPFPPLPPQLPDSAYEFYVALDFDPDR